MAFRQRTRIEAILPQMAGLTSPHIQPPGIIVVSPSKGPRQGAAAVRYRQQVNVIRHQAIAGDPNRRFLAVTPQEVEIGEAVPVVIKYRLLTVSALRDVVPAAGRHHARKSSHRVI